MKKHKILSILAGILLIGFLSGCEKDYQVYNANLHAARFTASPDSLTYSFGFYPNKETDTITVPVMILGFSEDRDRVVNIVEDSEKTTATAENDYEILTTKPSIEILESKATYVNGYVVARVTNNTGIDTEKSYLKIDFYTERDNYLGTKYAEIGELKKDQTYEVRTSFKFNGVDNYKVSVTNSVAGSTINDENDSLADAVMPLIGIAAVIMFFYYIF